MYHFKAAILLLPQSEQVSLFANALANAELKAGKESNSREEQVYNYLVQYLQNWYVKLSQRLTNWYKKKTRQRIFLPGIVMALLLNVDSVQPVCPVTQPGM